MTKGHGANDMFHQKVRRCRTGACENSVEGVPPFALFGLPFPASEVDPDARSESPLGCGGRDHLGQLSKLRSQLRTVRPWSLSDQLTTTAVGLETPISRTRSDDTDRRSWLTQLRSVDFTAARNESRVRKQITLLMGARSCSSLSYSRPIFMSLRDFD